jgi:iron complex outermembrane receptor protein
VYPAGRLSHYNAPSGAALPAEMQDFNATTGRVLLNWKPADDQLVYGTVSRGYKPGGTTPFADTYESEKVTNYELGWKGDAFEGAVTASAAVFYMQYDNFQRTYAPDPNNPATAVTNNVDGSKIKGFEAQLSGRLSGLRWDISYAYNDGTYGSLDVVLPVGIQDGVLPVAPSVLNLKGQAIDYLPKNAWNLGIAWHGLTLGAGQLIPSARLSFQESFYTTFYQFDYNLTPSKGVLDLAVAYEANADWRLEAYARNATDRVYISRAQGGSDARGFYLLGNPRQVGAKLTYRF